MKAWWRTLLSALTLFLVPAFAWASEEAAWEALANGEAIAIMRHALAPGTSDPAGFQLDDCATQRNLDERGRDQARTIGEEFRARGIAFDRVLSSEWCRCLDTARLLDLGDVERLQALNSFFDDRSQRTPQTNALRAFLDDHAEARLMLVTHHVNVRALTGRSARSGDIVVFTFEDGTVDVVGTIRTSAY